MAQTGWASTEGDDLFFKVRGRGKPLLMIPPGGGDGWQYAAVAEILADESRVITHNRRANGRSTMNEPQNFEISQQLGCELVKFPGHLGSSMDMPLEWAAALHSILHRAEEIKN